MKTFILGIATATLMTSASVAHDHTGHELHGVWNGEGWVMTVTQHGYMVASTPDGMAVAILSYTVEGNTVTARDVSSPPYASTEDAQCAMNNDAVFTYAIEGDQLTFSLVSDACTGRGATIDGTVATRRAMGGQ